MRSKVIHIKDAPAGWNSLSETQHVYIGRRQRFDKDGQVQSTDPQYCLPGQAGYFGNPVVVGSRAMCPVCLQYNKHPDRGSTLPCYEKYARERIAHDPTFARLVKELANKTLVCFCKPNPCHGDILATLCEELNKS